MVVKAAARDHDYRFDTPAVGPETIEAAATGGATVLAVEAGASAVLDRADVAVRAADAAGMALVSRRMSGRASSPAVMLVAGEASGDLHGAALCRRCARCARTRGSFGMGGPRMAAAGMELLVDVT